MYLGRLTIRAIRSLGFSHLPKATGLRGEGCRTQPLQQRVAFIELSICCPSRFCVHRSPRWLTRFQDEGRERVACRLAKTRSHEESRSANHLHDDMTSFRGRVRRQRWTTEAQAATLQASAAGSIGHRHTPEESTLLTGNAGNHTALFEPPPEVTTNIG